MPLWAERHGDSKAEAARLLFLMLLSGATGTILIGAVADRIGLRRTLIVTQTLLAPLILTFIYAGGVVGAPGAGWVGTAAGITTPIVAVTGLGASVCTPERMPDSSP